MAILGGGAYYYYTTTQNRIEALVENNATLEANVQTLQNANETNLNTIDQLQENYAEAQENYSKLQGRFQDIRSQNNELRERLGKHDLGALAEAKPELVERIINNASKEALRCFELLSGAPLTQNERNAKNARQFNSECPWLWSGSEENNSSINDDIPRYTLP